DRDSEGRFVKVLDFGISKVVGEATRLTGSGAVMGTVLYMSPEQVRAQPNVDTRADIWALGVILYEALAGRAPWEGNSHQIAASIVSNDPPDIRRFASVPDVVATTIHKMVQRDPSRRHATVRDVLATLAPFAPAMSIGAAVADQIVNGTSGGRPRPQLPPDPTRT
ncbi:protein kinase, partial [Salmonella enterica subsp. enterica serovar Istanbul]|nr:protein kinase [Salmonella enterica subsp. enterica serovar Istanbul]